MDGDFSVLLMMLLYIYMTEQETYVYTNLVSSVIIIFNITCGFLRLLFMLSKSYLEDFEYLKYYGRRLSEELEQLFDCQVHIHRGSAYLLSGDDCRMGSVFPGNNSISDILLLCFGKMRKKIENDEWKTAADESCCIDQIEFENLIKDVKKEYGSGFSKNYREMPEGEFVKSVIDEMEVWMFIRKAEADHQIKICPLTGKIQGSYPADYMGGRNDE